MIRSKWRKILCAAALCLCAAAFSLFGACSAGGTVKTLQSLADGGIIGEEDIQDIAALRNGSLQKVSEGEEGELIFETLEFSAQAPAAPLADGEEEELLRDFERFIEDRYRAAHLDCAVTQSALVAYFGEYGGYAVAEVEFEATGLELTEESADLIVSDYYFGKIAGNRLLIAWTSGAVKG